MRTRYWLVFVATVLAGLTLLLTSALLPHSSVAVAAVPFVTVTPISTFNVLPNSVLATPDLVVESITFGPAHPDVGESVNITVTVKNVGSAATSGFYVHLYVDPADEPPTQTTAYTSRTYWGIPLDPGTSFHWVRVGHTFAISGAHSVYAWVDRDNDVAESDETNNVTGPVNIPVGTVCSPDAYEDDDLCSQANSIPTDGTEQQHNLHPAPDKDWVKFDGIGGITYRVQAIADGADADLVAELHGTCSGPPSFGAGAEFEFTAPADGTYYVKVEHVLVDYGLDTAYRLRITALNLCNGYYEPNDTCATAADIAVDAAPQPHTFCQAGDADWVRFQTMDGSTYVISATNVGADADVQLSLYTLCGASPVLTDGQRLDYTALTDGFAYVEAKNLNPYIYGPGTEYTLQVLGSPPVASFTASPTDGYITTVFEFDASGCSDDEDPPSLLEVRWDWESDGIYDTDWSTTKIITHTYAVTGTYAICLQVRDTDHLIDSTTRSVMVSDVVGPKTFTALLVPGWNLVSIPLHPTDTAITQVLAPISDSYDLVYVYDGCDHGDPWKKYDPNAPPFTNDLTDLDETTSFWVNVTITDTLVVTGTVPSATAIPLCAGWNFIGYPSLQIQPITGMLSSIDGKYAIVYAYNAADVADPWKKYDPSAPPFANDLTEMRPGWGYWIRVSENCVWTVSD